MMKKKDIFDDLFVDKIVKCFWCDKTLCFIKNNKLKQVQDGFKLSKGDKQFCCEKHKRNYYCLVKHLNLIEKRLTILENIRDNEFAHRKFKQELGISEEKDGN